MSRRRLVVHAHFYQPFRVDPFTGRVPAGRRRPRRSATGTRGSPTECYRPIAERGHARPHLAGTSGPTLTGYLAGAAPEVLAGFAAADREGGGHRRSPRPSTTRSCRSRRRARPADRDPWGAARLRAAGSGAGRRRCGCPRPRWTSRRCARSRRPGSRRRSSRRGRRTSTHLDTRRPYRVDVGGGRHVTVAFYDGELSGAVSFEPAVTADADRFARERVAPRLARGPLGATAAAADRWSSRPTASCTATTSRSATCSSQRLVAPDEPAPDRGFDVVDARRRPSPSPTAIRTPRSGSATGRRGAATTASCAGPPSARTSRTAAGRRRCGRRWTGSPAASTRSPSALARDLPGLDDVVGGARRATSTWSSGPSSGDAFAAERLGRRADRRRPARGCSTLLEAQRWRLGDVRVVRLVLGGPVAAGDAAGAAGRGAGGAARRRARRDGTSRRGSSPTSRRSARPPSTSTAARSTAARSARSGSRRPRG